MSKTRTADTGSPGALVRWGDWDAAAFADAAAAGRPVLLNLTAFWCAWCREMDEATYATPELARLINEEFVAVRVDTDRHPHVQSRYLAGGWPTTAFLAPTGEVLWAGTFLDREQFGAVAQNVLSAWKERRAELEQEIGRRRLAVESTRGQDRASGLVRREPADDVLAAAQDTFDPRNGGFGEAPKFPLPEMLELLYVHGRADPACTSMADQTLDGMLAGDLWDRVEGGFHRYATAADWTAPRHEKLLDVNAGLLDAYALGACLRGRDDWREIAERAVSWTDRVLARDGLWALSQQADPDYYASDAAERASRAAPPVDETVHTAANARWIAALASAGARLGREDWIARADAALRELLRLMAAPAGGVFHYRAPGAAPALDFLLTDTLECARAALVLAQATGEPAWLDVARSLARHIEAKFWHDDGGFVDRLRSTHDVGMLRYQDRPFEENAAVARLLLDLEHVSGERRWRGLAERTLAAIGPLAGRFGPSAALFALATEEFFERPPSVFISVPPGVNGAAAAAAGLRSAACRLRIPSLRVWTVPAGHTVGPQHFPAEDRPVAWVWTRRGCAGPVAAADALAAAGAGVL